MVDMSVEKRPVKKRETKHWIPAERFVRGASHVYVLNARYVLARTDGNIWRNETQRLAAAREVSTLQLAKK